MRPFAFLNAMSSGTSKWWSWPEPSTQRAMISTTVFSVMPAGAGGTDDGGVGASRTTTQLFGSAPAGIAPAGTVIDQVPSAEVTVVDWDVNVLASTGGGVVPGVYTVKCTCESADLPAASVSVSASVCVPSGRAPVGKLTWVPVTVGVAVAAPSSVIALGVAVSLRSSAIAEAAETVAPSAGVEEAIVGRLLSTSRVTTLEAPTLPRSSVAVARMS